jgi:hypothetical protein
VFNYLLYNPTYGIHGFALPSGSIFRDQSFADYTALYLKGTYDNLERTSKMFFFFCTTTNAKVNWKKSSAIWASNQLKDYGLGIDVGLIWVLEGEGVKYLGVQIRYWFPIDANFGKLMLSLKGTLIS